MLGSGSDGLVLSGHTDTVPYDEGRWKYDPFRVTESGDRLVQPAHGGAEAARGEGDRGVGGLSLSFF